MILEQAERDRVQQLLCETLPAICQASLSGFADIKVDALIGITINKSDVFLVSIKETCNVDGGMDVEEAGGGRAAAKVNKIMAKTEGSTRRGNGRGRRRRAKRAASESEEEYVPTKKASQKGDNEHDTSTTRTPEQSEESPQKRSRVQRKSAVKAEASFQTQANEAPELAPDGTAEFSDEDFGGGDDDDDDYTDIDNNDDETEMTDIRQSIDDQAANLDRMIKQEPGSTAAEDGNSTTDGGGGGGDSSFLDRPFTASKASDDHTENTGDKDSSANEQCLGRPNNGASSSSGGPATLLTRDNQTIEAVVKELCQATVDDDEDDSEQPRPEKQTPQKPKGRPKKVDKQNKSGTSAANKKPAKMFKCPHCDFRSIHASNISRHKITHTAGYLKCSLCPVRLRSESELKKHEALHSAPLKCKLCPREFRSVSGYNYHKNTYHLKKYSYECSLCGKGLANKAIFEAHMSQKHGAPKKFECSLCQQQFSYAINLTRHEERCAVKHGMAKTHYNCEHCGIEFVDQRTMAAHIKGMHENQQVFCVCGKSFKWRASLWNHKRKCTAAISTE